MQIRIPDDTFRTEFDLSSALDHDKVEHDFHLFAFDPTNAIALATEDKLPHRHDYQEIIWIKNGPAAHQLDGEWVEILPGTLIIVPRGQIHWFKPSEMVEGCAIRFRDNFLPTNSSILFSQFLGHCHLTVPHGEQQVVESLFSVMRHEYGSFEHRRSSTIKFSMQALFAKLEEFRWLDLEKQHPTVTGRHRFWKEFNNLVEQHFRSRLGVDFYARRIGVSPRKLNDFIKPILGKTAGEVITERRILEAKRLLLFSDLGIKEITFELGYEEHSYFTKVFKKITGVTPTEFKLHNLIT